VKSFLAALQFLTLFPWPRRAERSADEIAAGAAFFPVIGLILGAVVVFVDWLLRPYLPPMLLAVVLVALLALLSRGFHLDGLADTFDGLGAGGPRERVLAVMDDPRAGVFGVVAVVFVILIKVAAVAALGAERWRALLVAPMIARWAMVLFAYRSTAARQGLAALLLARMDGADVFFATVFSLVVATVFSGARGVAVLALAALVTLAAKRYFHERLGGLTGDLFGAVAEISEAAALAVFAVGQL
jgi:adenosylcobinamide-GDP ribazoletransferase